MTEQAQAHAIIDRARRVHGASLDAMLGRTQSRIAIKARNEAAYRMWCETQMPLRKIAKALGRSDHSAARHAILGHCEAQGIAITRLNDLRDGVEPDLDWAKLAYGVAAWFETSGLTQQAAAQSLGIHRTVLRKAMRGLPVSPLPLLTLCRAIDIDPISLLPVSHETYGKHEGAP
ncbi:MAG: hypothetical protein AAGG69_02115 [Pseudomonadota bacterium]